MPTRRNAKPRTDTVEAVARRLPEELRNFGTHTDMNQRRLDILAWINSQGTDQGPILVQPVMDVVGLTFLSDIRDRLTVSAHA